ncbi:MAG TPA: diguanylate cyclase, partial [Candidatus Limnocylindrales bacterium]|nr:diguanylate cyclase [Candidatus Limnocylindrales bacterium]
KNVLKSAVDARKVLPLAFMLMLGFLVAMAWDGFSSTRELLNSQAYVEHTHQILHQMESIEDGLQDAREAWLHYVLTPEQQDKDTFEHAVALTWGELQKANSLTQDDPRMHAKIQDLYKWIGDEIQQLRSNMGTNHTLLIYHSKSADFRRDRVRDAIEKFKQDEEKVLREHHDAAEARARQIERSVAIRIGVFSTLMGGLFLLVLRDSKKLRIAEQSALLAQTRLESSLLQLRSETENSRLLNELQEDFQICVSPLEAHRVAASYLEKLVPGSAGTLFATRDENIESMASWPAPESPSQRIYSTEDCCAVRGGRLHAHLESPKGLTCRHFKGPVPDAYICFPLTALGETLGIVHVSAATPGLFTAPRLMLIQQIGEYAALRLANLKLREKLQDQSIRDPLTGLYNRRFLETTLEQELHRTGERRAGMGIGVIMADIDGFKLFNDTFGHEAGDHVLREVGALLRRSVRSEDVVCRYGGEEFLSLVPDTAPEGVCERAELMRIAIAKLELQHNGRPLGKITASFGVSFSQDNSLTSDELLRHADEALYLAKRSGCDCVRLSESVSRLLGQHENDGREAPAPIRPLSTTAKRA